MARVQMVAIREKQRLEKAGKLACAVCGWKPPVEFGRTALSRCIQLHHVVPIADGGVDAPENLIPLCPTHHAVAHALLAHRDGLQEGARPATPAALVEAIRWLDKPRDQRVRIVSAEGAAARARADHQRRIADFLEWMARRVSGQPEERGLRGAVNLLRDMIGPLPVWWRKGPNRAFLEACGKAEDPAA